jgi:hypothetical protein
MIHKSKELNKIVFSKNRLQFFSFSVVASDIQIYFPEQYINMSLQILKHMVVETSKFLLNRF